MTQSGRGTKTWWKKWCIWQQKTERNKAERNEAALCKDAKNKDSNRRGKHHGKLDVNKKNKTHVKRQNKVQTQKRVWENVSQNAFFCSDLSWLFVCQGHTTTSALFFLDRQERSFFYRLFPEKQRDGEKGAKLIWIPTVYPPQKKMPFCQGRTKLWRAEFFLLILRCRLIEGRRLCLCLCVYIRVCAVQWRATTRCCQCWLLFPEIANQRTTPTGNSHSSCLQLQMDLGTFPWSKRAKLDQNELDLAKLRWKGL